jgi:hypothetical protein
LIRRGALVGVVAGVAFAAWKYLAQHAPDTGGVRYEPQPFPMPPRPIPAPAPKPSAGPTVAPDATGNCPVTHPIKGKRSSGIFHQPGSFAYDRTRADACYVDATAAEHDGLRAAKR